MRVFNEHKVKHYVANEKDSMGVMEKLHYGSSLVFWGTLGYFLNYDKFSDATNTIKVCWKMTEPQTQSYSAVEDPIPQ